MKTKLMCLLADADVLMSAANQVWRLLAGPLVFVVIALFLSGAEQGFWYSFVSISALSVFADLGFTTILLQFSAHEVKLLRFVDGQLRFDTVEEQHAIRRLGSLFQFTRRWIALVVGVSFPIIFVIGFFLFSGRNTGVNWLGPWLIYVLASGLVFFNQALLSFYEGCNQVAKVQTIRLWMSLANTGVIAIGLASHWSLYALAVATVGYAGLATLLIFANYRRFNRQLISQSRGFEFGWGKSVLKLLWKYALSWSSGYFIFQLYTPLAFQQFGPEFAGKIGLSMSLIMAGFGISNLWLSSAYPRMNGLIALRSWNELDRLFRQRFIAGLTVYILGFGVFLVAYWWFRPEISVLQRLLPFVPFATLTVGWLVQYIVNSLAMYMRGHKEEPLVGLSVASSVLVASSTVILVYTVNREFMFAGFLVSQFLLLPFVIKLYRRYKGPRHSVSCD